MFILASFIITKRWNQFKCLSMSKRIKKKKKGLYFGIIFNLKKERNPDMFYNIDES